MRFGKLFTLLLLFSIPAVLLQTGCAKEYSFEGRPVDSLDTVQIINPPATTAYSTCNPCNNNTLGDSSWRLTFDGKIYCGKAEKTIMNPARTGFTFFGPSACSADSGFVATVYIENNVLDADRSNIRARLACYYYDKLGPSYLFMSDPGITLMMTITQYDFRTGKASGTFSGFVDTDNGRQEVKDGSFRIRF